VRTIIILNKSITTALEPSGLAGIDHFSFDPGLEAGFNNEPGGGPLAQGAVCAQHGQAGNFHLKDPA